jgi:hypothetical protein
VATRRLDAARKGDLTVDLKGIETKTKASN